MATQVVVYVKPGCTLCDPVMRTLEKVRQDTDFQLTKVDISGDAALSERYGHEVPVVTIEGRKAFKGHVTEAAFKKKLMKARELAAAHDRSGADEPEEDDADRSVPPRPIAAVLLAATVGAFAYFVWQGVVEAYGGQGRLSGQLLRVEPRDQRVIKFSLESIDGRKVSLDDYRGKVVFLNFWATWCPPCVEEMPSMIRLAERMKNHPKLVMLAVSADESWPVVREFWKDKPKPAFEILLDPSGKIAKEYGTTMFPETYVVADGKIVGFIEGPRDWDKWFADEYLNNIR